MTPLALVHSSFAVSLSLTALAVLVLGVVAWLRRREARGGAALAWLCLAATAWAACGAGRLAAGAGPSGTVWLELQRAAEALVPLALLAYALRATRLLTRSAGALLWPLAGLSAVLVALAFGPVGGLSLFHALQPGELLSHSVMVAVPSVWNVAGSALGAAMVAAALVLLALALQAAAPGVAGSQAWTLLGVAMPVAAEVVAALLPGGTAGPKGMAVSGLAPGAFLLAPAALAAAQGLLGGSRYLAQEGEAEPPPAAGTAPRQLLDHLDQPVLLVGASDTVSYANAAAARLFHPPDGLPGARVAALFGDLPELTAGLAARRRSVLELELLRGSVAHPYEVWLTPLFEPSGRYSGTLLAFVDIATRRLAEAESGAAAAELGRSQALMEALQDALRGALRGESLGMLLDIVLTGAAGSLAVPHAALYLYDASSDALHRRVAVGGFESLEEPPQRRDEGLAGRVWASGRPLAVDALPNWPVAASEAAEPWAGTAVAVPVRERGQAVGVLLVARRRGDWRAFTAGEIGALERFADLAAVAV
ncbi:MAG: GAF domain-containing protein, partial [Deinococcales bacterium]